MNSPKVLLLVEDEALVRHELKEALVEAGFDVTEAASGGEAVREFEASASRIRGLITDINLGKAPEAGRLPAAAENSSRTYRWSISAVTAPPIGHRKESRTV